MTGTLLFREVLIFILSIEIHSFYCKISEHVVILHGSPAMVTFSFFYNPSSQGDVEMRVPFYQKTRYPRFEIAPGTEVHMMEIVDFLKWVLDRDNLEIADYLDGMGQNPFFLVAATGLGKTVGVPIHMLIRQIQRVGLNSDPKPRVWVVEPRIPIALGQAAFMNMLWQDYQSTKGKKRVPPLFGCITSASGNTNPDAPVKFVTTGIFELMTKDGQLSPSRDRVVIDEAHVTIEQNPGVELGIALARKTGITVDYMSATVNTDGLSQALGATVINADKQRFTVWRHNLLASTSRSLADVVENTLVKPNLSSEYYPQLGDFSQAAEVRRAVTETGRSHGMLVVVNSFAGEFSDTQRLAQIIRKAHPSVAVLQLASEVIRDPRRMREYEEALKRIERAHQNYVILATSVVEMGITFPTLDYVVTMDSGYEQETIGDVTFPVVAPLGVNSLLQRFGRVGRKRPGIAYIANEIGADYAELDDEELNDRRTLVYEPITFPLASSPLMPLAYYACKQRWHDIGAKVAELNLPSRLHQNADRMAYLQEQIATLRTLGLVHGNQLTPLGVSMEKWIGQANLAYAVQLQRCLTEDASLLDVTFWIVATALSNTPIRTLRAKYDFFIDRDGSHSELPHRVDVWSHRVHHEDMSAIMLIANSATQHPNVLFSSATLQPSDSDMFVFRQWCGHSGVDVRKLLQAAKAIQETWKLFGRINGDSTRYRALFGNARSARLGSLPWQELRSDFPRSKSWEQLYGLSGTVTIQIAASSNAGSYNWTDAAHGRKGLLSQDDTSVLLEDGHSYTTILVPGRETRGGEESWSVSHLGAKRAKASRATSNTQKRSLWRRLFGWLFG
jgi:hypothetical protein